MSGNASEDTLSTKIDETFKQLTPQFKKILQESVENKLRYRSDKEITNEIVLESALEIVEMLGMSRFGYVLPRSAVKNWRDGILSSINASVLLASILTVVFGVLAAFSNGQPSTVASFLDLSKIFAGAIVGAAGATTISRRSS